MNESGKLSLIFDGECAFCRRSLALFQCVDYRKRIRLVDANDTAAVLADFPVLRDADTDHAIYAIDSRQNVYRGFFAFRRLIWNSPITWPLILVFYFPGAAHFGVRIYAWVAMRRSRMGCASNVCELPRTPDDVDAPKQP